MVTHTIGGYIQLLQLDYSIYLVKYIHIKKIFVRFESSLTPPMHTTQLFINCFTYQIAFVYNNLTAQCKPVRTQSLFKKKLFHHFILRNLFIRNLELLNLCLLNSERIGNGDRKMLKLP